MKWASTDADNDDNFAAHIHTHTHTHSYSTQVRQVSQVHASLTQNDLSKRTLFFFDWMKQKNVINWIESRKRYSEKTLRSLFDSNWS